MPLGIVNEELMKRAFDVVCALLLLVLASPLMAGLAMLITLQDGGSPFYRGTRAGLGGRPFRMLKFRTMIPRADALGGPSTPDGDPRVTAIGRWLRKHKLDEVPQLYNVCVGDMSLVGPRPEVQQYVDLYSEEERAILTVRPGLTDWASLWNIDEGSLLKGSPDPEKAYLETIRPMKVRLQLAYVRQRSFGTDLRILLHTAIALVRGRGACPLPSAVEKGCATCME